MFRFLHLRVALAGVLWLCLAVDAGHAAAATQSSPNGFVRGYYQRVRRDWGWEETRYVSCDVLVITAGDGFIVNPLVELVKQGNNVNELDGRGRLKLNLDLRGVPADLRRRVTQSSPAKPVELTVRMVEFEGRGAEDCESFVHIVAIDGKLLPGASGNVSEAAPAATAPSQASMAATWFFSPHPAGQLEAVRSMNAAMQTFQGGLIVYLDDVKQSFVLFNDGTWVNAGAGLDAAAAQFAGRLGNAANAKRNFQSCGGHVVDGDQVTAYVKDASGRVLAWTILASSYTPAGWRVVPGARVRGC